MKLLLVLLAAVQLAAGETPGSTAADPLTRYAPKSLSPSRDEKDILKFCMEYRDRELKKIPAIASGRTAYTSDGAETRYFDACLRAHRSREN